MINDLIIALSKQDIVGYYIYKDNGAGLYEKKFLWAETKTNSRALSQAYKFVNFHDSGLSSV